MKHDMLFLINYKKVFLYNKSKKSVWFINSVDYLNLNYKHFRWVVSGDVAVKGINNLTAWNLSIV